jgi:DNA ligase (NAD+)
VPLRLLVYEGYFDPPPATHHAVTEELAALGFPVNSRNVVIGAAAGDPADLEDLIGRYAAERSGLPYQIDGLVFKVDELGVREELGFTGHHPRWAVAYKFESPQGVTTVEKIEIQVGRTGRITPVARVKPVEIGGAVIVNVTLHNQAYVDALELSEGDQVAVSRRGDVIPAVERVVEKNENAPLWRMPAVCPSCGAALEDRGAHRFCPNAEACPDQRKGRLVFFAGKGQMDIENLGAETLEFLWREGLVRDIPDIYRIPYEKLLEYPGFGEKKIELIRRGVEKSRLRPFRVVLPSLGIPEVGTKATEILIDGGLDSMDKLFATADRRDTGALTALHGIGDKTAGRIVAELVRPEVRRLVEALRAEGLSLAAEPRPAADAGLHQVFAGQTWCVTGSFAHYKPRDLAMEEVKRRGGKAVSAVSGAVTHLLAGEGAGSKLDKARKLGIAVVSEEEFLRMIGEGES